MKVASIVNAVDVFRKTGICPLNPDASTEDFPLKILK
jgi:hypothetical protein